MDHALGVLGRLATERLGAAGPAFDKGLDRLNRACRAARKANAHEILGWVKRTATPTPNRPNCPDHESSAFAKAKPTRTRIFLQVTNFSSISVDGCLNSAASRQNG